MKGFRTLLFAALVAVIGVLEAFNWADVVPDNLEAYVLPIIGLIFMYLRKITDTPIGTSETKN